MRSSAQGTLTGWIWRGIGGGAFIQEGHDNCWAMRSAIFCFFALCLLLFLVLLAGRRSDSTPDNLLLFISSVVYVPLNVQIDFSGFFR